MEFRLSRFIVSVPEMFTFFLIGLLLVLTGLAGLQFTYLFYFDRIDRERKKHIRSLESRAEKLAERVEMAERRVDELSAVVQRYAPEYKMDDESWADVIEDR